MKTDLSIIIISYKVKNQLLDCLQSVYKHCQGFNFEVIVVDNASNDGTVELIRKEFPQVRLIVNTQNLGFAKANNQGIQKSQGEYLVLLNPDTKLPQNTFQKMMDLLKENQKIGLVGPTLQNSNDTLQSSIGEFPTLTSLTFQAVYLDRIWPFYTFLPAVFYSLQHPIYQKSASVSWLSGACLMFRRNLIEKIGLLDENFFMYYEDVDFCYRARKIGQECYYLKDAQIYHFQGASTVKGINYSIARRFRSLKYYFHQHKSQFAQALLPLILTFYLIPRAIFSLISFNQARLYSYWLAAKELF